MRSVNLVPPEFVIARRRADRARIWTAVAMVYSVIALSTGALAWSAGRVGGENKDRLADLNELTQKQDASLQKAREELSVATRKIAAAREVSVHPNWTLLLRAIAGFRGADVVLSGLSIKPIMPEVPRSTGTKSGPAALNATNATGGQSETNPIGYLMRLDGEARAQRSVTDFVLRLESSRVFATVRLVESKSRAQTVGSGKDARTWEIVGFSLECKLVDHGGGAP